MLLFNINVVLQSRFEWDFVFRRAIRIQSKYINCSITCCLYRKQVHSLNNLNFPCLLLSWPFFQPYLLQFLFFNWRLPSWFLCCWQYSSWLQLFLRYFWDCCLPKYTCPPPPLPNHIWNSKSFVIVMLVSLLFTWWKIQKFITISIS